MNGQGIYSFEELAALHAIARILAKPGELKEQITQALQEMSARLGMQRGMVSLLDRETREAWLDVVYGVDIKSINVTYLPGEGITGKVAQTGRPLAIENLGKELHFLDRTGARRFLNRSELSFLCVPIIYGTQVVGVLSADKAAKQVADIEKEIAILSAVAEMLAKAVHSRAMEEENRRLRDLIGSNRLPTFDIIGRSRAMQAVFQMIAQVADSNTTVLLHGETGTGKELVSRAIHNNSPRMKGQLVQVNCAAIPETLLESELFGHERGAFTGALARRRGRFEEANGGTILLDEIGELSFSAQAKLLRVLQERQFQPLGSSRLIKVDVRIIAATNRNLEQDVSLGRFRSDLFYRLNVFPIYLPPLRERGTDILLLADYFVVKYSRETGKPAQKISPAVSDIFMAYHWPGNVRELENCIERAILVAHGATIEPEHLPPSLQSCIKEVVKTAFSRLDAAVKSEERAMIVNALRETAGNQTRAAKLLGTTKRIMQYRISKLGIDYRSFRKK
ncbi:MAG: sigma-54 interaction domain-containing protein [Syntrophales bacterium]